MLHLGEGESPRWKLQKRHETVNVEGGPEVEALDVGPALAAVTILNCQSTQSVRRRLRRIARLKTQANWNMRVLECNLRGAECLLRLIWQHLSRLLRWNAVCRHIRG